jgi:hypothetical protein
MMKKLNDILSLLHGSTSQERELLAEPKLLEMVAVKDKAVDPGQGDQGHPGQGYQGQKAKQHASRAVIEARQEVWKSFRLRPRASLG